MTVDTVRGLEGEQDLDRVPYAAISQEVIGKMFEAAEVVPEDVVCDLGCGDGRILFTAVKEFGTKKAIGYEIDGKLHQSCIEKAQQENLHDRVDVRQGDMLKAELSEVSVITLYLSVRGNEMVRPTLEREAKAGTRVVSYLFPMTEWQSTKEVELGKYAFGSECFRELIYVYTVPESFHKANC